MSSSSEDDSKQEYNRSWGTPNGTSTSDKDLAAGVEKLVIVKDEEIGMIPDLKHLYGGKEDKRGRFTWQVKRSNLQGQFQLTSSLSAEQAGQAARRHWQTE